jgi:hypothetical protein
MGVRSGCYTLYAGKQLQPKDLLQVYNFKNGATLNIVSSANPLPNPQGAACTVLVKLPEGPIIEVKSKKKPSSRWP